MIKRQALLLFIAVAFSALLVSAEDKTSNTPPRRLTLEEAVQLALKHNHDVRIAGYKAEEKEHAKQGAKSSYFPAIRNDSSFLRLTDTQFIQLEAGSLGAAAGTPIPPVSQTINQGGRTLASSGTQITQPLTNLLKIRRANDMAAAELAVARKKTQLTENDVALTVHQVYYKILIAQTHRYAAQAQIEALQDLESERLQEVKFGSALQQDLTESRAGLLQAKQDLLTTDLTISDLKLKLNDLIGTPLSTAVELDPKVAEPVSACSREECISLAKVSHPEIQAAQDEVKKAEAAVRLVKTDIWLPDVEVFGRHSYQNNVPFLARNFGTFGIHLGYDVFDSGRKRAALRERDAQLSQAKENLAKLTDEIELNVQTTYNRLERTQQMLKVSEEMVALRTESNRTLQQQLVHGAALRSQAASATAQEYEAKATLLQSQLDYLQAHDELTHAIGRTPQ